MLNNLDLMVVVVAVKKKKKAEDVGLYRAIGMYDPVNKKMQFSVSGTVKLDEDAYLSFCNKLQDFGLTTAELWQTVVNNVLFQSPEIKTMLNDALTQKIKQHQLDQEKEIKYKKLTPAAIYKLLDEVDKEDKEKNFEDFEKGTYNVDKENEK